MITPDGYRILSQHILQGDFILELGDQLADWSEGSGKQRADRLIEDEFNCTVLSVDIHGKNHSLSLDLNQPLIKDWSFNADIVTDFGTIEHTDDIYQALRNVHQFWSKTAYQFMLIQTGHMIGMAIFTLQSNSGEFTLT
ncbi:MAG: hypothetical protein IPJ66_11755 [Bacteroidetes bacterium]|nr:hypothetical protein [Bacteroidota bacterium]